MAVITPVGKFDFDWSPKASESKEEMVKTASAKGKPAQPKVVAKTSKDLLYEAAKKCMAQFDDTEVKDDVEDVVELGEDGGDAGDLGDAAEDIGEATDVSDEVEVDVEEAVESDVQEAVAELVEKAEAADQLADAVGEALNKVEEAVIEVKNAVGGEAVDVVEDMAGDSAGDSFGDDEVVEIEIVDDSEDLGGEDIIIESEPDTECCGAMASVKKDLAKSAGADQLVKTSKISPTTRQKVLKFWKDDLGYVADYAKLMTTNYEK